MQNALKTYKKLLLLLKQKGKSLGRPQKQSLVRTIIALEQRITQALVAKMLSGTLDLNITKLPPRIQKIVQIALNRRLHTIYSIDRAQKRQKKHEEKTRKDLAKISLNILAQNSKNISKRNTSTPLDVLKNTSSKSETHQKTNKKILKNIKGYELDL